MNITELPIELLMAICCQLPQIADLLTFESVCRLFKGAVQQEEVWKKRIRSDYSLLSYVSEKSPVFRRRGFRQLYRALRNPQVFVWGAKGDGRLGIPLETLQRYGGLHREIDYPFWLKSMSDKGVSVIVCGGYMMLALTHTNQLYFWGSFNAESYMMPQAEVHETPILLDIFPSGSQILHVAAGRSHALALTKDGRLYQFDNAEERASLITFDQIQYTVTQLACGFNSSICLTKEQKIFYWKYEAGVKTDHYRSLITPSLGENETVTKIAGGEHFVLASTNLGHVIRWEIFNPRPHSEEVHAPSELLNLTLGDVITGQFMMEAADLAVGHVVAQFRNFGLFDNKGQLSLGRCDPGAEVETCEWRLEKPKKIDDDGSPILCSFGDWHTGVVLDNGHLYTWGEHGLGQGPSDTGTSSSPQRVGYFKDNYFVFYASCAGWHTAALAVDLSIPAALEPPEYPGPVFERARLPRHQFMTPHYEEEFH